MNNTQKIIPKKRGKKGNHCFAKISIILFYSEKEKIHQDYLFLSNKFLFLLKKWMDGSSIRECTMNNISLNIATETSLKKNVIVTAHGNKSHTIVKYFGCHSTVLSSAYVLTLHMPDYIFEN